MRRVYRVYEMALLCKFMRGRIGGSGGCRCVWRGCGRASGGPEIAEEESHGCVSRGSVGLCSIEAAFIVGALFFVGRCAWMCLSVGVGVLVCRWFLTTAR